MLFLWNFEFYIKRIKMKKLVLLLTGLALGCNSSQKTVKEGAAQAKAPVNPVTLAETITEAELKDHLFTYASDEFEGRETGTPGQKKAVNYLKAEYEALGIPAAQSDGNYFQNVPLEMAKLPTGSITAAGTEYQLGEDFLVFESAEGTFANVVYAGYGVEEGDYSDYDGLDVAGKLVLIKSGEPVNESGIYAVSGTTESSAWGNASEAIGKKSEVALEKKAAGVLYYDAQNFGRFNQRFQFMKKNASGRMSLKSDEKTPPLVLIDTDMAKAIHPAIEDQHDAKTIAVPFSFSLKSANEQIASENVVAVLKGSEKPEEYVVISSHLDHIGVTADGQINNGADDDGSGTVALLEIAEAFKTAADAGNGPKRSIVFLHVTGEEKGLLGSKYYTDVDPVFPLAQTVANLNICLLYTSDAADE